LQEDPWERLRRIKQLAPRTPLQMLLRAQNLVGYRNYADDVVRDFCRHSVDCGMDIFRVFDALNDGRNFETVFEALRGTGAHLQATISFSTTERRIGGPVFTLDYYRRKAKEYVDLGAHSLCIKDMAGILTPEDAHLLVTELKKFIDVPIQLHSHFTAGLADLTYYKAAVAGVDVVDCSVAPFAYRSGQPAVEPLVVALADTPRDTGLELEPLFEIADYLETIAPKYRQFLGSAKTAIIDVGVLQHQIPGGMLSNLINQLREANALDQLDAVYKELPQTRKDLGYPPLVTPTSQIVGVQAVMNVLGGERYKLISTEVKDLCYGLYGRPPAPIDPEVRRKCLTGYPRGETPIDCRPADVLAPELDKAKADVKDITTDIGDVLTYALYPRTGLAFLRYKYGLDPAPPGEKPKTVEDLKREDELVRKALAGELSAKPKPPDAATAHVVRVAVDGEVFEVQVDADDLATVFANAPAARSASPRAVAAPPPPAPKANPGPAKVAAAPTSAAPVGKGAVVAPMPGTVVRYLVKEGDTVKAGQPVVVVEAMKMENTLPAPADGVVKALLHSPGATVKRGEPLVLIE
jgi:pyruvate carboxylase subunit B